MKKCHAHLSGSGLSNIGALCRKPATDEWQGSPRCAYHMGVERRREAKRNAPHEHRAWMSTTKLRPDGSMYGWCANCGEAMFDTAKDTAATS